MHAHDHLCQCQSRLLRGSTGWGGEARRPTLRNLGQRSMYSCFSQIRGWHMSGIPCCLRRAGHAQRMAAFDEGCIRLDPRH